MSTTPPLPVAAPSGPAALSDQEPAPPSPPVGVESASTPSWRSPLLARPGAVEASGPDAGTAWHYGDPVREQRLLEEGLAVVDLSGRGVVRVAGPDRLRWLDSLTSQRLVDLAPRTSAESLLLSPQGRVEHVLHVVDDGEATWLVVEGAEAAPLTAWLDSMRFMLRVEVSDVSDDWAVLGEPVDRESTDGEVLAWVDPWPRAVGPATARYTPADLPDADHPGAQRRWREVLVPRAGLVAAVGDRPLAGTWAAEAGRVAAWRPRWAFETDERAVPHEVDWLRTAVHLAKGCYRGQETIAKVHNLGRPPRRLVMLHLDGSGAALPEPGEEVTDATAGGSGRVVGRVTSSARHHELGPIALALVRRALPLDAPLRAGGVAAAQEVVVDPDAGGQRDAAQRPRAVPLRRPAGR